MMMRYNAGEFLFLHFDIPKNWTRLSAKRVVPNDDPSAEYDTWTLPELQGFAQRNDFLQPDEEGFHDRALLIRAIMRGEGVVK